jgi:multidrug efflux pump subunit AcrA (membrane-fusion protein)
LTMVETDTTKPETRAPVALEPQFQLIPTSPPSRPEQAATPPPPMPVVVHRPRWPILVVLLLLLVGVASWWLFASSQARSQPLSWPLPWAQPAGPLIASGTLEADEVLVGAEVAGRIIELVQEGQAVQADAVVAKLDDALIQIQIRQADLATRQRLEIQADRYLLRSPINGVVTRVPLHRGEVIAPGQTAVAVADLTVLDLTVYVLARDLGHVQVGQQVAVTVDPFPNRTFRGVVTATNPRAEFTPRNVQTQRDRLNLVFGVQVRVDNPDGALKPGMPADATFPALP